MSRENGYDEENLQTPSQKEIIERHKKANAPGHNKTSSRNENLENALRKRTIKPSSVASIPSTISKATTSSNLDDGEMDSSVEDTSADIAGKAAVAAKGVVNLAFSLVKNKWLYIGIAGASLFFLILIILLSFLFKNADGINYVSGTYLESEEYRKIYDEVESVVKQYQRKYGVQVDKYLIISALTSYQGNENYSDNTDSGLYDEIIVEDEESGVIDKSVTQMKNYVELLAKYQIKTTTNCSFDSSTMRGIASNDDSNNILNFWQSAVAKEKNYDCSGTSGSKSYSLSNERGKINDDNSGSTFYWNLVDEDFFRDYYPEFFDGLSDEQYLTVADETIEYIYMYAETLKTYDTTNTTVTACNGTAFWWPIGSAETSVNMGKVLASGKPVYTKITTPYAAVDGLHSNPHGGLDISWSGDINIIASKAGTVIYPTLPSQISYPDLSDTSSSDGGGYGNYVKIEHTDGTYSLYAHMRKDSITVMSGDKVMQGQVIGKMGSSGRSSGQHLHFEIYDESGVRKNPGEYVSEENPRSGCADFSLTTTSLTKQEFVTKMRNYCSETNNQAFCTNFANRAEEVYDISKNNNVNPELVVITAGTEQGWEKTCGYNFYGLGISNGQGCSSGAQYATFADGVKGFANHIQEYLEGGGNAAKITARYNERSSAGCDPSGHGLPGTFVGMQSVYSWVGWYRLNPGSWGYGGCKALNVMYGSDYCSTVPTCPGKKDDSGCTSAAKTTVCEQNDYTKWQAKSKVDMRKDIFGL